MIKTYGCPSSNTSQLISKMSNSQEHKWSDIENLPRPDKLVWNMESHSRHLIEHEEVCIWSLVHLWINILIRAGFLRHELHKIQILLTPRRWQPASCVKIRVTSYSPDIEENLQWWSETEITLNSWERYPLIGYYFAKNIYFRPWADVIMFYAQARWLIAIPGWRKKTEENDNILKWTWVKTNDNLAHFFMFMLLGCNYIFFYLFQSGLLFILLCFHKYGKDSNRPAYSSVQFITK